METRWKPWKTRNWPPSSRSENKWIDQKARAQEKVCLYRYYVIVASTGPCKTRTAVCGPHFNSPHIWVPVLYPVPNAQSAFNTAVRSPQSAVRSPQSAVRSPQSAVRVTYTDGNPTILDLDCVNRLKCWTQKQISLPSQNYIYTRKPDACALIKISQSVREKLDSYCKNSI